VERAFPPPEDIGLTVEVLADERGRHWLDSEVARLRDEDGGRGEEVAGALTRWLTDQVKEVVRDAEAGEHLDSVLSSRRYDLDRKVETFFREAAGPFRQVLVDMNVWKALVKEAELRGVESRQAVRDYIVDKVAELSKRALPLWNLNGSPYEINLDRVTITAFDEKSYTAVQADLHLPDLRDLVSSVLGDITPVRGQTPYEVTVVQFEYGTPVGLFAPFGDYRQAYRRVTERETVPLLTDYRFVKDERYFLPDPGFAAAPPERLCFLVAEHVYGTVKKGSDETLTWDGADRSFSSRAQAREAFAKASTNGSVYRNTVMLWNRLTPSEQAKHLGDIRAVLEDEVERLNGQGHAARDRDAEDLLEDLNAVKAVLAEERYQI